MELIGLADAGLGVVALVVLAYVIFHLVRAIPLLVESVNKLQVVVMELDGTLTRQGVKINAIDANIAEAKETILNHDEWAKQAASLQAKYAKDTDTNVKSVLRGQLTHTQKIEESSKLLQAIKSNTDNLPALQVAINEVIVNGEKQVQLGQELLAIVQSFKPEPKTKPETSE